MSNQKEKIDGVTVTTLAKLDIFSYLDRDVAVLVGDDGQPWSEDIRVCLSPASLEEQILRFGKRAATFTLGYVIQFLLDNNGKHLFLYGFTLGDFVLEREELESKVYSIVTFNRLYQCYQDKLSAAQAYELLKDRTFYYLGSPLLTHPENPFSFDTINKDGEEYIKLFFSEETAEKNNLRRLQVVPINLASFLIFISGKFKVMIEWEKVYRIIF